MRVVTWNINGVRTLPQYHPWNSFKTFDEILNHLDADIICFQEMKSSRQALPKHVALPPSFDSFFSFPFRKTGYSGTAIYTRRSCAVPLKAEEGLTGLIQPKPPLSPAERVSRVGTYPPDVGVRRAEDEGEDEDGGEETEHADRDDKDMDYKSLDSEGRAVVLDLGLFVLINTYCPNDGTGTEEREKFKMDFHRLLEARINGLIEEGREVMLVGDINACAGVEDHCEGQIMVDRGLAVGLEGDEGFWGKDSRRWMWDLLIHEDEDGGKGRGKMVDIVRKFWPDRKGMYTCWNTKISARDTNYGTRIDFILITPGLVPWIKAADIQPDIKGSDHCPVFVDFYDEITTSASSSSSAAADSAANANANATTTTKLRDVLGARPTPATATETEAEAGGGELQAAEPPRMAAKNWDEHKQFLLSNFFGKKAPGSGATPAPKPMFTLKPVAASASASASAAPVPTTKSKSKSAASKPSPKSKLSPKSKSTPKPTPAVPPSRTKSSESASASETAMNVDDSPSPSGSLSRSHNREESSGSASTSAPASAAMTMVVDPPAPSQSQAQAQAQAQDPAQIQSESESQVQVSVATRSESESQSQQPLSSHSSSSTTPTAISATATLTPRPTLSKRKLALAAITVPSKKAKTSSSSSSRVPKISPLSSSLQVPKETGTKAEAKTTKEKEKTGNAGLTSKSAITMKGRGKTADATSSTTITTASSSSSSASTPIDVDVNADEDADYRLALLLSQSDDNVTPLSLPSSSQQNQGSPQGTARPEKGKLKLKEKANANAHEKEKERESKQAWTALLAPTQAPLCFVHQEPAKEYTVNKPGPNKGKKFFICSRPVGPGYDKGRAERPREQVDPQYKCDFFKWSSDVRKEMARKSKPNSNGNGNGNGNGSASA